MCIRDSVCSLSSLSFFLLPPRVCVCVCAGRVFAAVVCMQTGRHCFTSYLASSQMSSAARRSVDPMTRGHSDTKIFNMRARRHKDASQIGVYDVSASLHLSSCSELSVCPPPTNLFHRPPIHPPTASLSPSLRLDSSVRFPFPHPCTVRCRRATVDSEEHRASPPLQFTASSLGSTLTEVMRARNAKCSSMTATAANVKITPKKKKKKKEKKNFRDQFAFT